MGAAGPGRSRATERTARDADDRAGERRNRRTGNERTDGRTDGQTDERYGDRIRNGRWSIEARQHIHSSSEENSGIYPRAPELSSLSVSVPSSSSSFPDRPLSRQHLFHSSFSNDILLPPSRSLAPVPRQTSAPLGRTRRCSWYVPGPLPLVRTHRASSLPTNTPRYTELLLVYQHRIRLPSASHGAPGIRRYRSGVYNKGDPFVRASSFASTIPQSSGAEKETGPRPSIESRP